MFKKVIALIIILIIISVIIFFVLPPKECNQGDAIYPGAIKNCICIGQKEMEYYGMGRFMTCRGILIKTYY